MRQSKEYWNEKAIYSGYGQNDFMDNPELDKALVKESIKAIENIDYSVSTIEEIDQLLKPLFTGYRTIAIRNDKGIYVSRTRKCAKPNNIREVTFPPAGKATMGRANEQGKPIFYASIGKSVPFFELEPAIGDTVVISTWRTTEDMMLNQVGYTKEASTELKSARDFETELGFRKEMLSFGDDNETVYKHLANWFSRKIEPDETAKYKLTIAIAQRLMSGDIFHGIFYPTVKMFGNADNVALKTDFVQRAMKLVSIEFARITGKTSDNFSIAILDTAVLWGADGNIEWPGRLLGWTIPSQASQKVVSEGGEWIAKDERDVRVDPYPTSLIDIDPSPMLFRYKKAYPTTFKNEGDRQAEGPEEKVTIRFAVHLDLEAKEKFLSFYIPHCKSPFDVAKSLANSYDSFYNFGADEIEIISKDKESTETVSSKEVKNVKFIHFFTEDYIDVNFLGTQVIAGYQIKLDCASPPATTFNYLYQPKRNPMTKCI